MTDTFDTVSTPDSGDQGVDTSANVSTPVDYKKKYDGLNSLYSKVRDERDRLKREVENASIQTESQLAEMRKQLEGVTPKISEYETRVGALTTEKATLESELNRLRAEREAAKLIANDYKPLRDLADKGYLKLPNEFGDPEGYKAYLDDMLATVGTGVKRMIPPAVGGGAKQPNSQARSKEEVMNDIDRLRKSPRMADYNQKYEALLDELEQVG